MVTPLARDTFMKALLSKNPSHSNDNQHFKDSSHVISVQKRKEDKVGGEGDVACIGRTEMHKGVSREKINERDHL